MPQLFLVRHGLTKENTEHILQGHMPGHLTPEGVKQVEALRDKLRLIPLDAIISSDLKRCADTTLILNAQLNLPTYYTPLLRERDWGPFTGMNILQARTSVDDRAETTKQLFIRASRFLTAACNRFPSARLLIVSHGLFLRVIQAAAAHKTIRDIPRMDNAEIRTLNLQSPFNFPVPDDCG